MPKAIDEALEQAELERERRTIEVEPGGTSLTLLQQVYRCAALPLTTRMRAAIEALPYENPKLSAIGFGYLSGDDFASRLERAVNRSEGALKLIEAHAIEVDDGSR